VPGGGGDRIEIDLPRQVLFLYQGDALVKILPVSTGSGKRYCDEGDCGVAATPAGAYHIAYKVSGWEKSHLGRMYNPMYFDPGRGLAIHGFPSVPPEPASHGCVRIPMAAADWLPKQAPNGMLVYVLDGQTLVGPAPPPAGP
jgi:lipoprotein-anchoring transpeptidase ErfK/SrfK